MCFVRAENQVWALGLDKEMMGNKIIHMKYFSNAAQLEHMNCDFYDV